MSLVYAENSDEMDVRFTCLYVRPKCAIPIT
jgi:hypothetical protein